MTIGADDYYCGEHPPLSSTDFPSPATRVVDPLCQAPSNAGGCHPLAYEPNWREMVSDLREAVVLLGRERERLTTENTELRQQLAHYRRQG
jgi:hypothetical protein